MTMPRRKRALRALVVLTSILGWVACSSSPTTSTTAVSPTASPSPAPTPTPLGPDQANLVETGSSMGCGAPPMGTGSLFQGFTPAVAPLKRVMVRLRAGGDFPSAGTTSTVTIRAGSPRGADVASASVLVAGPRATGELIDVRFPLPHATLTPGQLYVIGWSSPRAGDAVLTWMATPHDTYPRGHAYDCSGYSLPDNDFIFATYAD
jgi:hypothetical protein